MWLENCFRWSYIYNTRWGYPFLYETYLYHIHRLDHAHNFSPYWLPIRLSLPEYAPTIDGPPPAWQHFARSPLASFIPQMALSLGTGLYFGRAGAKHLPFTWFVQTAWFVTLNKVCTSQVRSPQPLWKNKYVFVDLLKFDYISISFGILRFFRLSCPRCRSRLRKPSH